MNEEERDLFNKLAVKVHVHQLILVELCRRHLSADEIATFLAPLDPGVAIAWGDPEFTELVDEALAAFRLSVQERTRM